MKYIRFMQHVLAIVFVLMFITGASTNGNDTDRKKDKAKVKVKSKNKKDKNKNKVKSVFDGNTFEVDDSSSITIGSSGKSGKKGKVVINDVVIPEKHLKNAKTNNLKIRAKNNEVWINGKKIDLTDTSKSKTIEKKELSKEEASKLREQLRNFFGDTWEKYVDSKLKLRQSPFKSILKTKIQQSDQKNSNTPVTIKVK